MIPWSLLDSARVPGDGGEMLFYRRGSEFSIRVGGYELMNSRAYGSEDALAEMTCERLRDRNRARVLIGGLGMGFTLAGVVARLGKASEIVVAELVPEVVRWNRNEMAEVNGAALADRRVTVIEKDVLQVIRSTKGGFDAIMLDVDNGPNAMTSKGNDRIYSASGLRAAHGALRENGLLAVWSAGPDPAFAQRLRKAGFTVEELGVRSRGRGGGHRYVIWIGTR